MDLSCQADLAVRLANTVAGGEKAGSADAHDISTVDRLRALVADLRYPGVPVSKADLAAMRALAVELRAIFAACAAGRAAEAAGRLNALLIRHPVHPQLCGHDGQRWHLHLTQGGCLADRCAAEAAMGLALLVSRIGAERLAICRRAGCQRVFIDASTNGSRRFCRDRCAPRTAVPPIRPRGHRDKPARLPIAVT